MRWAGLSRNYFNRNMRVGRAQRRRISAAVGAACCCCCYSCCCVPFCPSRCIDARRDALVAVPAATTSEAGAALESLSKVGIPLFIRNFPGPSGEIIFLKSGHTAHGYGFRFPFVS